MEEPAATTPIASARLLRNHCAGTDTCQTRSMSAFGPGIRLSASASAVGITNALWRSTCSSEDQTRTHHNGEDNRTRDALQDALQMLQ